MKPGTTVKVKTPAFAPPRLSWKDIGLAVLLIVGIGSAVYGNALRASFVFDDDYLVSGNPVIRSWSNASRILWQDIGAGTEKKGDFYRPLQVLTYMADYAAWRLKPAGYHATNVVLHIAVSLALFFFVFALFREYGLALLTSLFFLVHPVHTEAITYVSGRSDPLALFFLLLAFLLYLRQLKKPRWDLIAAVCGAYAAALLSREGSVIFPFLILVYHLVWRRKIDRPAFGSVVGLTVVYAFVRLVLLRPLLSESVQTTSFLQRLPGFFVALFSYLRLLLLPFGLHMEYGKKLFAFSEPAVWMGLALLAGLLIYISRSRLRPPLIGFAVLWFIVGILPVSNLYPINAYMAEHWLYLPSLGFFLALASLVCFLYKRQGTRPVAAVLGLGLLVFYSFLTVRQNRTWQEPVAFYERTLKYAPDSTRVLINLANAYLDKGRPQESVTLYERSIQLNPREPEAYNNLGNAYQVLGKPEEAVPLYEKAIAIKPNYGRPYYNLGKTYHLRGEVAKAIPLYEKAVGLEPGYVPALNNLGLAYADTGEADKAKAMYENAIRLDPAYVRAYFNLGQLYADAGDYSRAADLYRRALEVDPGFEPAKEALGIK